MKKIILVIVLLAGLIGIAVIIPSLIQIPLCDAIHTWIFRAFEGTSNNDEQLFSQFLAEYNCTLIDFEDINGIQIREWKQPIPKSLQGFKGYKINYSCSNEGEWEIFLLKKDKSLYVYDKTLGGCSTETLHVINDLDYDGNNKYIKEQILRRI